MPPHTLHVLSSGDLVADRRLQLARDYAAGGEPAAAAELVEQALERVPDWAAGWFALAEFRETAAETADPPAAPDPAGLRDAAVAAYREVLRLDAEDPFGATLRLARLGALPVPAAPPPAHVRHLFDGYADRFEASLVTALGYCGPERIAGLIATHAPTRRFAAALDLGCGTGLVAPAIRPRVDRLDGVDLAPAMVARARAGGLYDALEVGDVVAALAARPPTSLDLITAGDVFCYLGDLAEVFRAAAHALVPGGLFAFTTEAVTEDEPGDDVVLRDSLRWAHRRRHLEGRGAQAGFTVVAIEAATLRRDRGRELAGHFALFTRS